MCKVYVFIEFFSMGKCQITKGTDRRLFFSIHNFNASFGRTKYNIDLCLQLFLCVYKHSLTFKHLFVLILFETPAEKAVMKITQPLYEIHAVPPYKKHSYKKRLVEFIKHKKRQLVDIRTAKKRVSKPN